MCCTWLAENTGCKKYPKKLPFAHHHTHLSGCTFRTKAHIDNCKKNLLNSNISSACPHNMVNFGSLTAEIGWRVWGTPANFNGFTSWLRCCTYVSQRRSTKHCTVFGRLLGWYTIYIFGGCCPVMEFCPCAEFTLRASLVFYIGSVTAQHLSSGRQSNFAGVA